MSECAESFLALRCGPDREDVAALDAKNIISLRLRDITRLHYRNDLLRNGITQLTLVARQERQTKQ